MLKIGVSVKDALLLEPQDKKHRYSIILAARKDNVNSKKIQDLAKAMTSKNVKDFLLNNYDKEGYPTF